MKMQLSWVEWHHALVMAAQLLQHLIGDHLLFKIKILMMVVAAVVNATPAASDDDGSRGNVISMTSSDADVITLNNLYK